MNRPVHLTAQLPVSLSPLSRPTHTIAPSPVFGARRRGNSSSSSSLSDSPIQSPSTNASATDSPQKESFNLPPPAYPAAFSIGSVPVKIPGAGFASRVPSATNSGVATPGSHTTVYPVGTSVDTLRFGRKSSVTNSVTSPLALAPRCGCGRALGHRARSGDRQREPAAAEGISCLSLGPSLTTTDDTAPPRMMSDPSFRAPRTPNFGCPPLPEERSIAHVLGSSLLSRSRSDPAAPSSPRQSRGGIHPRPAPTINGGVTADLSSPKRVDHAPLPPVVHQRSRTGANALPTPSDEHRGRSRERVPLGRGDVTPDRPSAKLLYHENREIAPTRTSRSGVRDNERGERRSRSRGTDIGLALNLGAGERGRAQRVYA